MSLSPSFIMDASATLAWVFEDERTDETDALLGRLDKEAVLVPTLWVFEVANTLVVAERRGRLSAAKITIFVNALRSLPIVIAETDSNLMGQIIQIARDRRLSGYDAAYVLLALKTGLPLATLDRKIIAVSQDIGITIL